MKVKKRNGSFEDVSFDKIIERLQKLSENYTNIDCGLIAQKVVSRMSDGMSTIELDELSSQLCMEMNTSHPEYSSLGSDISINNHHKNTKDSFYETCLTLLNNTDKIGNHSPLINDEMWNIVNNFKDIIEKMIEGRLKKYVKEICVESQPFVKNPQFSVSQIIEQTEKELGLKINFETFEKYQF